MREGAPEPLLLGVDGGASGLRLHVVAILAAGRLRASGRSLETRWGGARDFTPVALERQLAERAELEAGRLRLPDAERAQGEAWASTLADALVELTRGLARPGGLLVGVCLPGAARADGAGVVALRNGPRLPSFRDDLLRALAARDLLPCTGDVPLVGDGEAAGWGEEVEPSGLLGGVADAYYVACGTGVAEALKLGGEHLPSAARRALLPAPWSLASESGGTLEDELSLRTLARRLELDPGEALEEAARRAGPRQREALARWAEALGAFLGARVVALARAAGRAPERVVVGQRSGMLLADERLARVVREPLAARLRSELEGARASGAALPAGWLCASTLRAAPALGAAALALRRLGRAAAWA